MKERRAEKVGRKKAQELIGNGADVEKSGETQAQEQQHLSLPSLPPSSCGKQETQTEIGQTKSDHAVGACSQWGEPPTHTHTNVHMYACVTDVQRKMRT